MSELLGDGNLRGTPWLTMVVARAAVPSQWVSAWIRLTAQRLLSFAEENTVP
jgi:hypothetical protein